jgi:predicted ATPase/class 3 adenylate cyclase/Tfp pilus assembly protein PilF
VHALLFTDVVDSTRLTQALGDRAAAELWTAHDRLARDLLRGHNGREIDRADGLFILFEVAEEAVRFALDYHAALRTLPVPMSARAGIHIGEVSLRENSAADIALGAKRLEVEGLAKPVAARVMSAALGGQTLLTADAFAALGPQDHCVRSHGHWRLAGVEGVLELIEIGDPQAPLRPPPDAPKAHRVVRRGELWLPAREIPHTLPAERDGFVGRIAPLRELSERLGRGARLLSVLGMGGTGKTRLATRFAWGWLAEFPGGAWFCDLSQARDVDGIFLALAQGLEIPLDKLDPAGQLERVIAARGKCLVVLDNFEQVVRHARQTVGRWLDQAPEACFLVTSREVLGIPGEEAVQLAPLPGDEGTELFVQRARAARPSFVPEGDDRAAIERLVRILDGLPLAIELAAARMRVMSPQALVARIGERFKLLASPRGRPDRQATLRATFDWSWDLLSEPEKAALAQVSVFAGGFTLEAAERVLEAGSAGGWPIELVQALVDKSFVRRVGDERFDLLESVREYAAEQLETPGRYAGSGRVARIDAETRHGRYFAALDLQLLNDRNDFFDVENFVVACRRAVARGDFEVSPAACEGAWSLLRFRGPFRVGTDLIELALTTPGLTEDAKTRLQLLTGRSLLLCGDVPNARISLEAGRDSARRRGDRLQEGRARADLAETHVLQGQMEEALVEYESALAIAEALRNLPLQCSVLNGLGTYYENLGQFAQARPRFEAALEVARRGGYRRWEGGAVGNLGQLFANLGFSDQALIHYEEAAAIARQLGDLQWEGNILCNLGLLNHAQGDAGAARTNLEASLAIARDLGHTRLESIVLCNLGIVLESLAEPAAARRAYESALAIARRRNDRRSEGQFLGYLGLLDVREDRIDEARRGLLAGASILRDVKDRVSLAILLCAQAQAEGMAGAAEAAEAALHEAAAIAASAGVEANSELGLALVEARVRLAACEAG